MLPIQLRGSRIEREREKAREEKREREKAREEKSKGEREGE